VLEVENRWRLGGGAHATSLAAIRKADEGLVLRSCRGIRPSSAAAD
jgi:hypothetical protein